jgi:hypothetical protein
MKSSRFQCELNGSGRLTIIIVLDMSSNASPRVSRKRIYFLTDINGLCVVETLLVFLIFTAGAVALI